MVAKKTICDILFSSSTISSVPTENGNTIFPYLYTLLKFDSLEMLSCLNEFFEDLFLNEDPKLNRQYLIEALIDIFEANDEQFTDFDKCQLLIFIARNYPKYSQFYDYQIQYYQMFSIDYVKISRNLFSWIVNWHYRVYYLILNQKMNIMWKNWKWQNIIMY